MDNNIIAAVENHIEYIHILIKDNNTSIETLENTINDCINRINMYKIKILIKNNIELSTKINIMYIDIIYIILINIKSKKINIYQDIIEKIRLKGINI